MKLKNMLSGVFPALFAASVSLANGDLPDANGIAANNVEITIGGKKTVIDNGITNVGDCIKAVEEKVSADPVIGARLRLAQGTIECKSGDDVVAIIKAGTKAGGAIHLRATTPTGTQIKTSSIESTLPEASV